MSIRSLLCLIPLCVILSCSQKTNQPQSEAEQLVDTTALKPLPAAEQKLTSLELHYTAGEQFHYRLDQVETLTQEDTVSVTNHTRAYYTKAIKSVRDGIITLTIRYDSLVSDQKTRGMGPDNQDIHFNSNDSADKRNPKYVGVTALLGEEVTIQMDSRGRVQDVSGVAAIVNRIMNNSEKKIPEEARTQVSDQIKTVYYAQLMAQENQSLPDSALGSDMSWSKTSSQEVPPLFIANTTMKYNVAKLSSLQSRTVAEIKASMTGQIVLVRKNVPVTVKTGSISGEGSALVDAKGGYTLRKNTTAKQELDATMTNPQSKETQGLHQIKVTTMNVVLLK